MQGTLDVGALKHELEFKFDDGSTFDVAEFGRTIHPAIRAQATAGLVTAPEDFGYGFVFGRPMSVEDFDLGHHWNYPTEFVWCVGGYGIQAPEYIANATRKMRALLRLDTQSTLEVQQNYPDAFSDVVDSVQDDGTFAWGDFPWGGAVRITMGGMIFTCGVSGFTQRQDHAAALLLAEKLGGCFIKGNGLPQED